ncbi:MAG: transaldolase [Phycisphaerae bacterium]|nr:transaldolase [Phycisphaerae bacterium]
MTTGKRENLNREVEIFLKGGFSPRYDEARLAFKSSTLWQKFRELGTEVWLDTGSIQDAEALWTREFSALTTNNTLLNREIQTGCYDSVIPEMEELLELHGDLNEKEKRLEFAFMLNAWHAMRLVERFEAYVSVEEHTDLANDVTGAVAYARRYHRLCPERFIIKMPFTPAGLLATRLASNEGLPINHTLGFSARQNYVVVRIARPAFVNVFLGRLNSFISANGLGSGRFVGEKATLASQAAVGQIRTRYGVYTRQIGASLRNGQQIADLAGLDVLTMPPKAAQEFIASSPRMEDIGDRTGREYIAEVDDHVDTASIRLDTLWDIQPELIACVDALERENLDTFGPDDLVDFFDAHGCGDVFVRWSDEERAISAAEGKIPKLSNWHDKLADGTIALDSLMNLAGLTSFATDQKAMDKRVGEVLATQPAHHI